MAGWTEAGDGSYFDAGNAAELAEAISAAVSAPFRVQAADVESGAAAEPVASGTVGGGAVTVAPGTYRVEVLSDPVITFEDVVLGGGESVSLEQPGTAAPDTAP